MSLLDDVSIVVTPNGYKAGELYAVIPSDGASDMDVTRATAATRVDENGLVNYAEILSAELVVDGGFDDSGEWTSSNDTGGAWVISGGKATVDCSSNSILNNNSSYTIVTGTIYKCTFDITEFNSGTVRIRMGSGGTANGTVRAAVGTYTEYIVGVAGAKNINFEASFSSGFDGSIDNVSVKEAARDNVPRIDYTGGGCPHILAEPQRTNLIPYSEDFTVGNWTKSRCTVTSNQAISPDGTLNADLMTSTDVDARLEDAAGSSGSEFSSSIYVKSAQVSDVNCQIDFAGLNIVTFSANQEWQRVETTLTDTSVSPRLRLRILDSGNSIYVWGGQLEEGSYATSYIPTSGSTVTRNQDIFTRDGIGSLINSTEGVLFVEMAALSDDSTGRVMSLSDGTNNHRILLSYTSTTNQIQAFHNDNVSPVNLVFTVSDATDFHKVAFKYKVNDFALWIDGVEVATNNLKGVNTANTINELKFENASGSSDFYGKVKQLQVYKTALTDVQLAALTS